MLGASGVQMGTRFLAASECIVHENYKKAIIKAKDIDTVVTTTSTGHSVRCLRNKFTSQFNEEYASGALQRAVFDGDTQYGSVMAGQIAALVTKEQTALEIIEETWNGYLGLIGNVG
jgi:enoyl-[acyl-carrier protein] reductase II